MFKNLMIFSLVIIFVISLSGVVIAEPIKIACSTWVGYGPLYLARDKGFFYDNGVEVELISIEDRKESNIALASGVIDALATVIDQEVLLYAEGIDLKCFLALDESYGGDGIIAESSIKSIADLKGSTIGLDTASASYFFLLVALEKVGLTEKDVNILQMSAREAATAFTAGKLDAVVTWEPWLTNAKGSPRGHLLIDSTGEYAGIIVDAIVMRRDVAEKRPEAVEAISKSWFEAIDYWKEYPEDSNRIMADGLGIPLSDLEDMLSKVRLYDYEFNKSYFGTPQKPGPIYDMANKALNFWYDLGIIDDKPSVEDFINSGFIKTARQD